VSDRKGNQAKKEKTNTGILAVEKKGFPGAPDKNTAHPRETFAPTKTGHLRMFSRKEMKGGEKSFPGLWVSKGDETTPRKKKFVGERSRDAESSAYFVLKKQEKQRKVQVEGPEKMG